MEVDGEPPAEVTAAADARAAARAGRDWATADRLRGEIESAGWRVVDTGVAYRLEPAHPPDVVAAGEVRYGRSDAVPSRLAEPATGPATVIVIAREDPAGAERAARSVLATAPLEVDLVAVLDGLDDAARGPFDALAAMNDRLEIVRTSASLGQGAALNIGARRARGETLLVVDASIEATGDVVGPLVAALGDPGVGLAGAFGLASADLRHFDELDEGAAAAIEGYVMAFRRADHLSRGPVDEAFRFYRNLDIWWSLVLRDEGPDQLPRAARVVPGLPLVRHDHVAWSQLPPAERDRLSKRNFYRVLGRFRDREDLAVPRS
jgi:glycosyltransferase involved in cell wall biosynthesis